MKSIIPAIFLVMASACHGDILRISKLAAAAGEGAERMVLKVENVEEVLFVEKKALIGVADVKEAIADPANGGQILVKLNEEGGKKLKQASASLRHGLDRLALIVDGRVISAPVVQATLGSSFMINGFKDMEFNDLDALARRMSGRPPRPEGQNAEPPKPLPKRETVPFTEEEYEARKTMREKMGIFYLESVPSEDELNRVLRKGMGRDEVVKIFGKPYITSDHEDHGTFYLLYLIAPEKRPENWKLETLPNGFKANFSDGKLSKWSQTYSNATREMKVTGGEKPTLRAILPKIDFAAGDLDLVSYVEGIVIPDPKQSLNKRDLGDLIAIAVMLSNSIDEDSKEVTLVADCDFMKILSHNFADVATLLKSAKRGRVSIAKLNEILTPYTLGEKELPVKIRESEKPSTGQPASRPESKPEASDKP